MRLQPNKNINKIKKALIAGKTYQEIGEKYNLSTERIRQLANKFDLGKRREKNRKLKKELADKIKSDYLNGFVCSEIEKKYNITKSLINDYFRGPNNETLTKLERNKRTINIGTLFVNGETAKRIIKRNDIEIINPIKLVNIKSVYKSNSSIGIKRYPMIGDRTKAKGKTFEKKEILEYIKNKRDKHKWIFKRITNELNRLGYTTLTGKPFTEMNVIIKYYKDIK